MTGKGQRDLRGAVEKFYILIVVMGTQVGTLAKSYQTVHLEWVCVLLHVNYTSRICLEKKKLPLEAFLKGGGKT